MDFRIEKDSMGEIKVPADKVWGAQTQRSFMNFKIGDVKMPSQIISAFASLKKACAVVNGSIGKISEEKAALISQVADEILADKLSDNFPLSVFQTGSGTQSNMNVNEVIAGRGNQIKGEKLLHPNDDVNASQSSNDTFPSAMNIAAVCAVESMLLPSLEKLISAFSVLENKNPDIIKIGRTHLQDATPVKFAQEVSGWRGLLESARDMIVLSLSPLRKIAIGGTAVGTGLNAPKGFDKAVCDELTAALGTEFLPDENKFRALTGKEAFVFAHGALKALSANLMKIANDIRWLAAGPRCGLGELNIPENEPGSSIMPGKVNPTQCEAVTMVAVQVMGNDVTVGMAASQGNFELNVFMPVCAYNFLQSVRLLSDAMVSFTDNCVSGITVNENKMKEYLDRSLMLVTCLTPKIGYDKAAEAAKYAHKNGITLKESVVGQGLLTEAEFDEAVDPAKMV
ncbi:MAG: class II fumarate hydratase [Clostridia bacterium]|nr:class II fumarate hydratase [Clostridia bacterium]